MISEIEKLLNTFINQSFNMKEANEKSKIFWLNYSKSDQKKLIEDLLNYFHQNFTQNYFTNSLKMLCFIQINSPKVNHQNNHLNSFFSLGNEFIAIFIQ